MYRFTTALLSKNKIAISAALLDDCLRQRFAFYGDGLPAGIAFGILAAGRLFFQKPSFDESLPHLVLFSRSSWFREARSVKRLRSSSRSASLSGLRFLEDFVYVGADHVYSCWTIIYQKVSAHKKARPLCEPGFLHVLFARE